MSNYKTKLNKSIAAKPSVIEESVAQALFEIETSVAELKDALKYVTVANVREIETTVKGKKKNVYVVYVPFPVLRVVQRIIAKLVPELEKRLKTTVLIVGKRTIQSKWIKAHRSQMRPRNRALTAVYDAVLEDLVQPAGIIGRRYRHNLFFRKMSSLNFLESIVNKKRKAVDDLAKGNKFIRLGDLPQLSREKFEKKQQGLRDKDEENKTDELKVKADDVLSEVKDIPRPEVIKKLRERNLPIRLFGETDRDAFLRLRKNEVDEPELAIGWKNDFKAALNKGEEEVLNDIVHGSFGKKEKKNEFLIEPTEELWENIKERAQKLGMNDDIKQDCAVIYDFLVFILSKWQVELDSRSLDEKTSPKGKLRTGHFQQTMKDCEPLLRALAKNTVNSDQRCHLVNITRIILLDHNYIIANNCYMELAIGNAPWPVGVTRSGLHQRPGSAKAYVNQIAHILNNETQRKYIHGLKRVMSKCQDFYPADPSKMFEFIKKEDL